MHKKRQIKVCLSPALFDLYSDRKSLIVVVDILRATSAMCAAFHNGVKTITPVSTVEEALEYKSKSDYIIAAERNGKKVSDIDIYLDMPEIAENGNQVKIVFEIESPMNEEEYVKTVFVSLSIFITPSSLYFMYPSDVTLPDTFTLLEPCFMVFSHLFIE